MLNAAEQWTWVARIRRPQGRKGEVFAEILTDFPEKFAERRRLWLLAEESGSSSGPASQPDAKPASGLHPRQTAREVELLHHWLHKGGVVLHFSGVNSISDAETLTGLVVAVPRAERVRLDEDEAYVGDLIGCRLIDVGVAGGSGRPALVVGEIEDVDRTAGPVALLVVRGAAGEVLVPFAKSYLRRIDLEGGRVEMALPEGLIGLNAPE